jgi:peptidoglycan hydrolase-like protein with peptidoglycan-binding domain
VCGASNGSASSQTNSTYAAPASRSYTRTAPSTTSTKSHSTKTYSAPHASNAAGVLILDQRLEAQVRGDVKVLQHRLNHHGSNIAEDGQFGPQTAAAVKHYQEQHGLAADGRAGAATQRSLRNR